MLAINVSISMKNVCILKPTTIALRVISFNEFLLCGGSCTTSVAKSMKEIATVKA